MDLKEARLNVDEVRKLQGRGFMLPILNKMVDTAIILDDRITELESVMETEKKISKNWRDRYDNITSLIHKAVAVGKNQERDHPENELKKLINRITELEDELARRDNKDEERLQIEDQLDCIVEADGAIEEQR